MFSQLTKEENASIELIVKLARKYNQSLGDIDTTQEFIIMNQLEDEVNKAKKTWDASRLYYLILVLLKLDVPVITFRILSEDYYHDIVFINIPDEIFNKYGEQLEEVMFLAADSERWDIFNQLLLEGINPNCVQPITGISILIYAVECNAIEAVKMLLNSGADINFSSSTGKYPLVSAMDSHRANVKMFKTLLKYGGEKLELNKVLNNGNTYLTHLISCPFVNDVIETFVSPKSGFQLFNHIDQNGETAMHIAASIGNTKVLETLIEIGGMSVDIENKAGLTPLVLAIHAEQHSCVELLIDADAMIEAVDAESNTYFHVIANITPSFGKVEIANFLLTEMETQGMSRADIKDFLDMENSEKQTALELALYEENVDLVKLFLQYNVDVDHMDINGDPTISIPVSSGNLELFELIISKSKNIKTYVNNALSTQCLLVQTAIDNLVTLKNDPTPSLYRTRIASNQEIVKLLVKHGADLNKMQSFGQSPTDTIINESLLEFNDLLYLNVDHPKPEPSDADEQRVLFKLELKSRKRKRTHGSPKDASPKPSLKLNKGYNPILMETTSIPDWIQLHPDNLVIVFGDTSYCLKRSMFTENVILPYHILQECNPKSSNLKTVDLFIDLEKIGIPNSGVIPLRNLTQISNTNSPYRVYHIHKSKVEVNTISQFGIQNTRYRNPTVFAKLTPDQLHEDLFGIFDLKTMPHATDYTYKWDSRVNHYLRVGLPDNEFVKDPIHLKYYSTYASSPSDAIPKIKHKIAALDKMFLDYSEVSPVPFVVYRGTKDKQTDQPWTGINPGFISTSTAISVATGFSNKKNGCCLYKMEVMPGVPFLSMKRYSYFKSEFEILLPRGMFVELVDVKVENGLKVYNVRVKVPDQVLPNKTVPVLNYNAVEPKCKTQAILRIEETDKFMQQLKQRIAKMPSNLRIPTKTKLMERIQSLPSTPQTKKRVRRTHSLPTMQLKRDLELKPKQTKKNIFSGFEGEWDESENEQSPKIHKSKKPKRSKEPLEEGEVDENVQGGRMLASTTKKRVMKHSRLTKKSYVLH